MTSLHVRISILLTAALAAGCAGAPSTPDGGACTAGTAGCACLPDDRCTGGLVCDTGLCRDADRRELVVRDGRARSCEVVLVENGTEVVGVDFGAGVRGTFIREAPRTAVTFLRDADAAFGAGAVTVRSTDALGTVGLRRGRCFDRDGAELGADALGMGIAP